MCLRLDQVDGLLLTSAAFVGRSAVGVRVANNAQQFSASAASYEFYAPPRVGALCPSSGPLGGGTRVVVSGGLLKHGADRYCRFPVAGGAPPGPFWGGGGGGGGGLVNTTDAWRHDQAACVVRPVVRRR